jgi:TRAP-type transport system periplasmic protein
MPIDPRHLVAAAALATTIVLAGPAAAQQILKFSHTDTVVGSRQQAAELFANKVEEYTQGRYKVQVFHSGQLANDPKAVEQLRLGGIDFTVTGTGTYATFQKPLNLSALPFLVETYEQGWKLYDESPWFKEQFAALPAKGMRVLATFEAGFRSFTTTFPLNSPADAKGRKLRVFPNDMIRWIMESIGFNPVVLPVTEVYLAIQQGTVDGQENPVDTIYSIRFYEVAKYITLTQHVYSPIPLSVSEITWKRLSDADKAAVQKAASEAAEFSRKTVRAAEEGQLKEMQAKGAIVARPNLQPFREAVKAAYTKAREQYGAEVDRVLAEAEAIRQALPAKSN